MATAIEQQVALDEALVPSAQRFKIDTRKNIVDLEAFREMLHISPRVLGQSFAELPFKEEILEFLSLRLSQAQILWGLYHKRNVDYAFLIWEDFVYQVDHKNQKKSHEMYFPRFTKVIIHHFMTKKPSIPRRNKVNWHYARDDILLSTIKVAYKECYACATGEAAPKPKASARRKRGGSASSTTPPTPISTPTLITTVVATPRLTAAAKRKQPARATSLTDPSDVERIEAEQLKIVLRRSRQETHISQQGASSTDEGTVSKPGVPNVPSDDSEEEISWNSSDDEDATESGEGDDEETESDRESEEEETKEKEEESFDPIPRTPEDSKDDGNGEGDQGVRISEEERMQEEKEADELYRMESIFTTGSSFVTPIPSPKSMMTPSIITTTTTASQPPIPPTPIPSDILQTLPTFASVFCFEDRVKSLEVNFSEFMRTHQSPEAVSNIPGTQSRQMSASESAFAEEPVQTTCQMDEPSHPVFETGAEDQPIGGASSRKYTTSVTKTKAADYGHIKWIKDLVPRTMWIQEPLNYDKHALCGVSHWGRKRQQFYGFAVNQESALDVYSKRRIIAVTDLKIVKWHNYKHLDWISVRRDDDKIYKFKEGDFKRLRLQDIEDMLLLLVQGKLSKDHMIRRMLILSLQRSTLYKLIL
nr:hypothetical protein [Tanacetum cinerariifolium]